MVKSRNIGYPASHLLRVLMILLVGDGVRGQVVTRFTSDPQPVTARLGENVSLRCTISPPAPVFWIVNGFPLISNTSYDFKFDQVTGEHEVIIKNISMQRDGQYYCRTQITNPRPVKSQIAQVTVLVPPTQIKLIPFNPVTIVQENVETSLTCSVTGGKPAPSIQWFKDDVPIDAGVDTHISSSDATKIENVTSTLKWIPTRGEQEKRVFCTASHPALVSPGDAALRVDTQLIVEYAPAVKVVSDPDVIREGDSVTLQCVVDANPYIDLRFRWTKNGQPVPDVSGGSLHIEKVQRSERAALYGCEATNKIGTNSTAFPLDVQYAPTFFSMPEIKAADLNKDTFLTCNVDSNPPAVITWIHDTSSRVIGRETVLQVNTASDSDFGVYICVATVPGYPPIRKEIKVLKKGAPFISAEVSVYAGQGDSSVQIKCVINGVPLAENIRWTNPQGRLINPQIDKRVDIAQEVQLDRVISRLTIVNVKKDDFGMYNCSASNAFGGNDRLIPLKETDWMLPIIVGSACGGALLLVVIVITAILCIRCRSHSRLKQASDTSGSTTTSDDLDVKSANGTAGIHGGVIDMYNTSSSETLADGKQPVWTGQQEMLHSHPYTIHADYNRKDPQNYYTRYADYEQEYNPNTFMGLPAIYTPTMSIAEQEGSRDPSPYQPSGLPPRVEPLYSHHPAYNGSVMMLDATLNSRLATNV